MRSSRFSFVNPILDPFAANAPLREEIHCLLLRLILLPRQYLLDCGEPGFEGAVLSLERRDFGFLALDAFRLTCIRVALGQGAALGLTRLISALLFGVSPIELSTFGAVALVPCGVALLTSRHGKRAPVVRVTKTGL